MEGPQIPDPPFGFIYDANATQARNVFPDREMLSQSAWSTTGEIHNSIYITCYAGPSTQADVQAARDAQESMYKYLQYGSLEALTIDDRPAWGWLETQYHKGNLSSLEYKAVVSYDDVSYAVEFFADSPEYLSEAVLRDMVCSFETGKTKIDYALAAGGLLLAAIGILLIKRMSRPF